MLILWFCWSNFLRKDKGRENKCALRTPLGCVREIWSGKCDWCIWFNPKTTHFVYGCVYFIDGLTAKCSSPITSHFFSLQIALHQSNGGDVSSTEGVSSYKTVCAFYSWWNSFYQSFPCVLCFTLSSGLRGLFKAKWHKFSLLYIFC